VRRVVLLRPFESLALVVAPSGFGQTSLLKQ
jgi:hypothetical protein